MTRRGLVAENLLLTGWERIYRSLASEELFNLQNNTISNKNYNDR
jgi:hypothetical protein